jgi:DNA repair exonuclease SbcCD ATPase subunit
MGTEELEQAKLEALKAEKEKNLAEKNKLEKEATEIDKRLKSSFLGISFSSYLKTIMAGIVAGVLIWTISVDYPGKILSAHKNIVEINKIKGESEKELKRVEDERQRLEEETTDLEKKKEVLEDEKKVVENEKHKVESDLKEIEDKYDNLRKSYNDLAKLETEKIQNINELNKTIQLKTAVANVHAIESQLSNLPVDKKQVEAETTSEPDLKTAWVYLGEFENGLWKTRYFDFANNEKPRNLVGKTVRVSSQSINVREKMLTGKVVEILHKGDAVKIEEVDNYPLTDYMWAQINI